MQALLRRPFRLGMVATFVACILPVLFVAGPWAAAGVVGLALVFFLVLVRGSGFYELAESGQGSSRAAGVGSAIWASVASFSSADSSDGSGGGGCGGGGCGGGD